MYERERESTLQLYNVVYSKLIITLFNVGNVLLCVIYQLNCTIFMYVTRISRYVALYVYSVRYYLQFHVTAVGLGTYYPRLRASTCIYKNRCNVFRHGLAIIRHNTYLLPCRYGHAHV